MHDGDVAPTRSATSWTGLTLIPSLFSFKPKRTKSDFSTKALPPLPLWNTYRRNRWFESSGSIFLYILMGLIIWGAATAYRGQMRLTPSQYDFCEGRRSTGIARWFLIDTHLTHHLNFSQAKSIDILWDALAGQIGRILHGWVFYHVVTRTSTWMAERFAVPFDVFIDLSFSPTSPTTLISVTRLAFEKKPKNFTAMVVWLLLSIVYVLTFPTTWGAAAGYISSSVEGYQIPSIDGIGNFVTTKSDLLNLCWAADLRRVNGDQNAVVLGPSLIELHKPRTLGNGFRSLMTDFPNYTAMKQDQVQVSDEFKSLYTYALTKRTIENFFSLDDAGHSTPQSEQWEAQDPLNWEDVASEPCRASASSTGMTFAKKDESWQACLQRYPRDFVRNIIGWRFVTQEQMDLEELEDARYRPSPYSHNQLSWNTTSLAVDVTVKMTVERFELEDSLRNMSDTVPYNSSLWWQGRDVKLKAPFLDFGVYNESRCSWFGDNGNLPVCLCHKGIPITTNFIIKDDSLACILQNNDYVWGFASHMLLFASILEVLWLWSCALMWYRANQSLLVVNNRDGAGTIRRALDISGGIRRELGPATGAYRERQLKAELRRRNPIGYTVEARGDGTRCIQLQSLSADGLRRERHLDIRNDVLYN